MPRELDNKVLCVLGIGAFFAAMCNLFAAILFWWFVR